MRASWDVLTNAANCASATVLLVLENILRVDKPSRGEYGVLLAFGPGPSPSSSRRCACDESCGGGKMLRESLASPFMRRGA